jgi:hypothetical protein
MGITQWGLEERMREYPSDDCQEMKVCHTCPLQPNLSLECCWVGSEAACEAVIMTPPIPPGSQRADQPLFSFNKKVGILRLCPYPLVPRTIMEPLVKWLTLYLVPVQASSSTLLRSIAVRYNKELTKEQDALKQEL